MYPPYGGPIPQYGMPPPRPNISGYGPGPMPGPSMINPAEEKLKLTEELKRQSIF